MHEAREDPSIVERMKKVGRVAVMLQWEGGGAAGSGGEWQFS